MKLDGLAVVTSVKNLQVCRKNRPRKFSTAPKTTKVRRDWWFLRLDSSLSANSSLTESAKGLHCGDPGSLVNV